MTFDLISSAGTATRRFLKALGDKIMGGLLTPPDNGLQRWVKVRRNCKGFLVGQRWVSSSDPPFPLEDNRAADLVKAGLVDYCDPTAAASIDRSVEHATDPALNRAERPTLKR